jgi:endonuclease YncB( thermonuclease family)
MEDFFSFSGLDGIVDVLKIIDGDTIIISLPIDMKVCLMNKCGNFKLYIRLLGINTPEKKEAGYNQAKDRLTHLIGLHNNKVFIKFHHHDKYGRVLGEIYAPSDKSVSFNTILLKEGLAKQYSTQN